MKNGYVIVPKEDPTYFNDEVRKCISTLGTYKICPVCKKKFYIPPGCDSKWVYRIRKGKRYGKQVCSYSCNLKGNK